MAPTAPGLLPRFWAKVTEDDSSGCWLWTGAIGSRGYAHFRVDGRTVVGHRLAYEALVGDIPAGLVIDHLCRNRSCVNPWHLEPVPERINILRGEALSAQRARQTHCKRGHEFTPENTYVWQTARICRPCAAARRRGAAA